MNFKCETYSERCPNWDKEAWAFLPNGKYPKSRRIASRLYAVYVSRERFLLMCSSCKFEYLQKHPHLKQFNQRKSAAHKSELQKLTEDS